MTGAIDQKVFRLEIAVDVAHLMQHSYSDKHLHDVEPRNVLAQNAALGEQGAEITARNVFHHEINVIGILTLSVCLRAIKGTRHT